MYRQEDNSGAHTKVPSPVLILGGYSYGSLITAHLPARDVVCEIFESPGADSAENEIKLRAEDLSREAKAYFDMYSLGISLSPTKIRVKNREEPKPPSRGAIMGGYDSDTANRRVSRESSRRSLDGERVKQSIDNVRRKISHHRVTSSQKAEAPVERSHRAMDRVLVQVAYILISPLLPPIAGFTTMFSKLCFTGKGNAKKATSSPPEEFDELTTHPSICIYGSKDAFTSDRKLQRWTDQLGSKEGSRFVAVRTTSGHFWQDVEEIVRLQHALIDWLRELTDLGDSGALQPRECRDG